MEGGLVKTWCPASRSVARSSSCREEVSPEDDAYSFPQARPSRTTGLPNSTGDIGNWSEELGLASLFVEGAVVVLSAWA
jgi:hypothetical protein